MNESGDYYGLATRVIQTESLELEFLEHAGPRIVRLRLKGSNENLLAETPKDRWTTPYGEYSLRGGHRLWIAPEDLGQSSIPDDRGLRTEQSGEGVRIVQPAASPTHIQKSIDITLEAQRPVVTLRHALSNDGTRTADIAPWAITQLPLGGLAVLPQPDESTDTNRLRPNRHLVLWPYTQWRDPRLQLGDKYVLIDARPHAAPFKIGYLNPHGWVGYWRHGLFFVKRFEARPDQPHADRGCNVEVYCNDHYIELETLGPLMRLEPGQTVTHVEVWELYPGLDQPETAEDAVQSVQAWISAKR